MFLRRVFCLGLAALVVVLSACGSSSSGSTSSQPLTVGVVLPLTSNIGFIGQGELFALNKAVARVNSSGGILGRKVNVLTALDSAGDPAKALLAAQQIIDSDHPDFMIPDGLTTTTVPILPYTTKAKIVTMGTGVGPNTGDAKLFPYNYDQYPPNISAVTALVAAAKQVGGSTPKVGVLFSSDTYSQSLVAPLQDALSKAQIPVAAVQSFGSGAASMTVQASKLRDAGTNVILFDTATNINDSGTVLHAVQDIGWNDVKVVMTGYNAQANTLVPAGLAPRTFAINAALGLIGATGSTSNFVTLMSGQPSPFAASAATWNAIFLWKWAAEKAGSVSGAKVAAELNRLYQTPDSQLPAELVEYTNPEFSPTDHSLDNAKITWALIPYPQSHTDGTFTGSLLPTS